MSDSEIIEKAINAKNGAKFSRLWRGDWQAYYDRQEPGDLALCCHLMYWCDGDQGHVEQLFAKSGLYRKKWNRACYRRATLSKALATYLARKGK